jgi:SAM-dependent methyltransferase
MAGPTDMGQAPKSPSAAPAQLLKRVLNAGSGPHSARPLHPAFRKPLWQEVRLDIDPDMRPDLVGSITDMRKLVPSKSFDAVWSSHSLEHLYAHEVPAALSEFKRILKPTGFALITSPDLEAVATLLIKHGIDHIAYTSSVGPITPLDMIFGHSNSIADGRLFMGHNTGFTCTSLGKLLVEVGFPLVLTRRERLDLWALALADKADKVDIQRQLNGTGLEMCCDIESSHL